MVPGEIGILSEHRGVTETLPGVIGPSWALVEKRRGGQGRPHAPSPSSPNWTRRGQHPLSFLSPSSFPLLLLQLGKEEVLLPVGVELLPGAPPPGRPPLPPCSFIYEGRGAPLDTTIDPLDLLAVCGAPLHHSPP